MIFYRINFKLNQSDEKSDKSGILGLVRPFELRITSQIFLSDSFDERGRNDVERKFRFSFDVVYNLFIINSIKIFG